MEIARAQQARALTFLFFFLGTAGCAEPEVVRLVVVGTTLEGRWTIDGVSPDQTLCRQAGLESVRIAAAEMGGPGNAGFAVPCESGRVVMSGVLVPGRAYVLRLEGLRNGSVVLSGPETTIRVSPGGDRFVAPQWDIRTSGI
jgi:hypothetical protein